MPPTEHSKMSVTITGIKDMLAQGQNLLYEKVLSAMERILFAEVLSHFSGNKTKAAEALGITRWTLRRKLELIELKSPPHQNNHHPG